MTLSLGVVVSLMNVKNFLRHVSECCSRWSVVAYCSSVNIGSAGDEVACHQVEAGTRSYARVPSDLVEV